MNRAARVCSMAPCGEVWATAQAWNWALDHEAGAVSATQLQAEDMGQFSLKVRLGQGSAGRGANALCKSMAQCCAQLEECAVPESPG
jgi:hypothetical protein